MENQHRKIVGYRELTADDIALMNEIKAKGAEFADLIARVEQRTEAQYNAASCTTTGSQEECDRLAQANPWLWQQHATSSIQIGCMELIRAVAQPTTFC